MAETFDVLMPAEGMGQVADLVAERFRLHRLWLEKAPDAWLAEWGPRIRAVASNGRRNSAMECWFSVVLAGLALAGAFLVSYARARMEGLGVECKVGWFERPERLVVLLGAALFGAGSIVMPWALAALAVLSFFTAFQRMGYARSRLQGPA